jgi:hypothetical protein
MAATARSISPVAHVDRAHIHPERGRRGPNGAELSDPGRIGGIPKDSRSRTCGHTIPHFPYLPYSAPPWRGFFWRAIE